MKILFCNYEYPPIGGGGGVINAWIAEELAKTHDVTVLTSQCLDLPKESIQNGVKIIRIPAFFRKTRGAASFLSLLSYVVLGMLFGLRYLKGESFDVINTHFALPTGPVGQILAWRMGIANILSVHGGDIYDPSKASSPHNHWITRLVVRKILRAADVVVAQSNNTRENVHKLYLPDLPVEIIPLAIQRNAAVTVSNENIPISKEEIVLVTVGRLVGRKRVGMLLEIISNVKRTNLRLIVIGDGPKEKELKAQCKDLGIDDRVEFLGYVDGDVKNSVLASADVFVSTSEHEGFGIVFLEALSFGIPVLCYDNGGQVDFLVSGETGYLVSLDSVSEFSEKLEILVDSPHVREKMKSNCLSLVKNFYIDVCAEKYVELFEKCK